MNKEKHMSKIVFLDVDGTLIDYEAKTPASAKTAIAAARANGHKVYICTGCSKAEIEQRDLPELDGMIGGNGAYVEDNGTVVMHQGLSPEDVRHIVDWCNERHLGFYLEANSGMYCNDYMLEQGPETMVKYASGKGADLSAAKQSASRFINSFIHLQGEDLYRNDVNKISFILSSYQDHLDSKEEFPHLVANTWGGKGDSRCSVISGPQASPRNMRSKCFLITCMPTRKIRSRSETLRSIFPCLSCAHTMSLWATAVRRSRLQLTISQPTSMMTDCIMRSVISN